MEPACTLALSANFGSVEGWREAFAAGAKALGGGAGQMQLVFQPRDGALVNQWVTDPGHPLAGGEPILTLERRDPTAWPDAAAQVETFMARIDWAAVYARYLRGGIHGWQADGRPTQIKGDSMNPHVRHGVSSLPPEGAPAFFEAARQEAAP